MNSMQRHTRRGGQTIVEAMVAISLLIVGFLGIITLINRSIGLNRVVSDNYTATYLASEGIEVVKNLVDGNFIQNQPFFNGFASCTSGCDWEVQYDTTWAAANRPVAYSARLLSYDSTSHLYSYNSAFGEPTAFTRKVSVLLGGPQDNELTVHSVVTWKTRGGGQSTVDLEDHFYNWFTQ